ncbi:hypothetical protein CBR_g28019 [Chara braunii]|uniref:DUF659 domain-containing protein n=1 Tax=Chara braunii TaxID=69332 RepID=A0A388L930_CHABU|nr:hypothetical protein CBR_g28019 [Chara braunii]|eukprot:GBG78796.1 hypothetical protein CBR_g28019 [Chara braunii]
MEPAANADKTAVDDIKQDLRPPPASAREVRGTKDDIEGGTKDGEAITHVTPSCAGSSSAAKSGKTKQTSIRRWTENTAQKKLDMQWGRALFGSGVPFNFVRVDESRALHDLYMELGAAKAKVDMPTFDTLRTVVLDAVYEEVVDMSHRKTNAAAIAKLWEEVIKEIGVHRVNAICTGNAGVNKRVARILSQSTDPDIAKIPWVPCAAHTLSLLLKDMVKLPWVSKIVKRAKMMVKFIKNHHRTVSLFSACSLEERKTLIMPTEVRFASTFEMLNRLHDRRGVLEEMMERGWKNIHWSSRKLRDKADKIYHTVRSSRWWEEVYQIVLAMRPVNELLRRMDRDGVAPSSLWGFGEMLQSCLRSIRGITLQQEKEIMKIVDDRCKMMRQPVHVANFLLSPTRRDPRWVLDKNTPLVHNAIKHFLSQLGGERWGSQQNHLDVWQSLWAFHQKPPKDLCHKEPMRDTFGVADSSFGKPHERRTPLPRSAKGKAVMDMEEEEEEEEEEEDECGDEEDCDPDFAAVPPSYDNENEDDVACEEGFNVPDAHVDRMDSDVECWSEEPQRHAVETGSRDEVDRAAAKAMAERDRNLVKQRIQEEDARRAAAPLRSRPLMPQPPPGMRGDIRKRVQKHSEPSAEQQRSEAQRQAPEQQHSQVEQQRASGQEQELEHNMLSVQHQHFPFDEQQQVNQTKRDDWEQQAHQQSFQQPDQQLLHEAEEQQQVHQQRQLQHHKPDD